MNTPRGPERTSNPEAYSAARAYFRELLDGLIRGENFFNVSHALPLLPQLIISRQKLDEMHRRERRMRAGMKGAATRRAKAAKKGGA